MYATYDGQVEFDMQEGITREELHPRDRELALENGYIWTRKCDGKSKWYPVKKVWKEDERIAELANIDLLAKKQKQIHYRTNKTVKSCMKRICQEKVTVIGDPDDLDSFSWSKMIEYIDQGYKNIIVTPLVK